MRAWQSRGKKVDLKIKIRHLLDYVKLSGVMSRNTVQTFSFLLEVGQKGNLFVLSAVFWGAMLVFSLLRRGSDVYVGPKKSRYTRILWGALLPWQEAEPWENDSRRRVTADDNYNINIWEWERHPGKKVKAVCSQEQLRGGLPTVGQSSRQTKGRTDCTPHCRAQLRRSSFYKILSRSFDQQVESW